MPTEQAVQTPSWKELRESYSAQKICDLCGGVNRQGYAIDLGNPALGAFIQSRRDRCDTSCPGYRIPGRPGLGHESGVTFGKRAGNGISPER